MKTQLPWRLYGAWFGLNAFFMYVYALRVSSGIMCGELRTEFGMTGEQFGIFGACYLYSYALVQIPLGLLLDRFGVKKVALTCIIITILSMVSLSLSTNLTMAYTSRALLGAGSGAGLMSCLKFTADYLPPKWRAMFMGLTLSMSTIGALSAGHVVPSCLLCYNWRSIVQAFFMVGLPIALLAAFFLPKHTEKGETINVTSVMRHIKGAVTNKHIMLYGFLSVGVYTPLAVLADLWGVTFLKEQYHWDTAKASSMIMYMYIGLSVGGVLLPFLSRVVGNFNLVIQGALVTIFTCFILVLHGGSNLNEWLLLGGLLLIGMSCGGEMLCFNGASEYTTKANSGIVIGVVNTCNMLGGAIINQLIGRALDWQWQGTMVDGVRFYTGNNYAMALSIMPIVLGSCIVASVYLKKNRS